MFVSDSRKRFVYTGSSPSQRYVPVAVHTVTKSEKQTMTT